MFVDGGFLCVFVSFVVPFTSSELNTGRGIPGRALRMSRGEARNCSYETADQIDMEIPAGNATAASTFARRLCGNRDHIPLSQVVRLPALNARSAYLVRSGLFGVYQGSA